MPVATPLWIALLALLAATGCNRGAYRASNLPSQFQAPVVHSAQHLDLSRLSQSSQRNEVVYPGDTVNVSIATGLETRAMPSWLLRVSDTGAVNVPLVGDVDVGGLELNLAEAAIHEASISRGIYRNPQVSLTVARRRSNKVTVLGAVTKEGTYELPSNQSDLLSALVAAGGLSQEAHTLVEIRNPGAPYLLGDRPSPTGSTGVEPAAAEQSPEWAGEDDSQIQQAGYSNPAATAGPQTMRVDLAASEPGQRDLSVRDGGVVMVMRRPANNVQVFGLVKKPGQFDVPVEQELRLLDAVAMAGGLTTEMADKVLVVRQLPEQNKSVMIQVSIDKAKRDYVENIRLAPGDVVSVEETPLTFVTTELQKYIRFSVTAASRLAFF